MDEKLPEQMLVEDWNDFWFERIKPIGPEGHARLIIYQLMAGKVASSR